MSFFIFDIGGISPNHNEMLTHNNNILYIIEVDIGLSPELLQFITIKSYIQQLKFIEALSDDEDEDWPFVPKTILVHKHQKITRLKYKPMSDGEIKLVKPNN